MYAGRAALGVAKVKSVVGISGLKLGSLVAEAADQAMS